MNVILTIIWLLQKSDRECQSINKVVQKCDMERFNLKKLNDVEVIGQHQVKISNWFAALENLDDDDDDDVDISRV
jgi:hypothetical protein